MTLPVVLYHSTWEKAEENKDLIHQIGLLTTFVSDFQKYPDFQSDDIELLQKRVRNSRMSVRLYEREIMSLTKSWKYSRHKISKYVKTTTRSNIKKQEVLCPGLQGASKKKNNRKGKVVRFSLPEFEPKEVYAVDYEYQSEKIEKDNVSLREELVAAKSVFGDSCEKILELRTIQFCLSNSLENEAKCLERIQQFKDEISRLQITEEDEE
jgi:hypothetical protein